MTKNLSATQKPFAVFDIDGTIFRSSLLIELVNQLMAKGIFPSNVGAEIEIAHQAWLKRENFEAYETYLLTIIKAYETHIKGVTERKLELVAQSVIDELHRHTYVYTRELIEKLRPTHSLIAISGSPSELVKGFVAKYKFDAFVGTKYEIIEGVYTGNAKIASEHKREIIRAIAESHNLTFDNSYGVGDTKGDISLLESVEHAIAFNPDSNLRAYAQKHGWDIVVERKSEVYHLKETHGRYILE